MELKQNGLMWYSSVGVRIQYGIKNLLHASVWSESICRKYLILITQDSGAPRSAGPWQRPNGPRDSGDSKNERGKLSDMLCSLKQLPLLQKFAIVLCFAARWDIHAKSGCQISDCTTRLECSWDWSPASAGPPQHTIWACYTRTFIFLRNAGPKRWIWVILIQR